jgi:tetratricopeptide (TPR) repeat protein
MKSALPKGVEIEGENLSEKQMWEALPQSSGQEKAELLIALAHQASHRGSSEEALALAETAREIYESMGATAADAALADAYVGIGHSLRKLHREEDALKAIGKAVDIYRRDQYPYVDDLLRTQAGWYAEIDDWSSALACYQEAIVLNEVEDNQEWLARSLFSAGWCLTKMEKYTDAQSNFRRARAIFKTSEMVEQVGWCDERIAHCAYMLGEYLEAAAVGAGAQDVAFFCSNTKFHAHAHLVLARAHIALGNYERASGHIVDAQALARFADDKDWNLIVDIEQVRANHCRAQGMESDAQEIEARLVTIREILG